jgi:hypothetical protein
MKKFLVILVLGLLWCNVGFANDLDGKKLICEHVSHKDPAGDASWLHWVVGIEFLDPQEVRVTYVNDWTLIIRETTYSTTPLSIDIYLKKAFMRIRGLEHSSDFTINRETLQGGRSEFLAAKLALRQCRIVDFDVTKYVSNVFKRASQEQNKKNKL